MDILVGGIPRSGTTALARALARHPDVFCWSSETGLFPWIGDVIRDHVVNPATADKIRAVLRGHLKMNIIDMPDWNKTRGQADQHTAFLEHDVICLADGILDLLLQCGSRHNVLVDSSQYLRAFFSRFTDQTLIAEKTPGNILLYRDTPDLAKYWAMTHRDPFAVIASMQSRIGNDPWAIGFDGPIERRIGLFNVYAEQIVQAMADDHRSFVIGYEALMSNPASAMIKLCDMLGLVPNGNFLCDVRAIVGSDEKADHWKLFTPLDRWKIIYLTRYFMKSFGYDSDYYGLPLDEMLEGRVNHMQTQVIPMYGVSNDEGSRPGWWASPRAIFAVYTPDDARVVTFSLYNRVDQLAAALSQLDYPQRQYTVEAYDAECRAVGMIQLAPATVQQFSISLENIEPIAKHGQIRLYQIELRANFSYSPFALFRDSADVRNISYKIINWTIN